MGHYYYSYARRRIYCYVFLKSLKLYKKVYYLNLLFLLYFCLKSCLNNKFIILYLFNFYEIDFPIA